MDNGQWTMDNGQLKLRITNHDMSGATDELL